MLHLTCSRKDMIFMNNIDMTLRMMLNNINKFKNVGPRPYTSPKSPMHTPRNNFSFAMEMITEHSLSTKPDGSDMTSYQDTCILTPLGSRYLGMLNSEFRQFYTFYNL